MTKRIWVVEVSLCSDEAPYKYSAWLPTVGVALSRDEARKILKDWQKRNPSDRFRLGAYCGRHAREW